MIDDDNGMDYAPLQFDNPSAPNYDWQKDREWFNQRLANARIHNSELERKLAIARALLMEARQWKRKGYPVMRQRIDEFLGSPPSDATVDRTGAHE